MQRSQLIRVRVEKGQKDGFTYQLIDVPYRAQQYDEWCWAATLQMIVLTLTGQDVAQHVFAKLEHQCSQCDGSNPHAECRDGADVKSLAGLLLSFGLHGDRVGNLVEFGVLEKQIAAGQPVIYNITFQGGVDHAGIVAGTRKKNDQQEVYFIDPDRSFFDQANRPFRGWIAFNDLMNGYGLPGNWSDTVLNIHLG